MRLCTDECRVLGHSDQCWMPPLSSPASSDYRNNMYIPGEESQSQPPPHLHQQHQQHQQQQQQQQQGTDDDQASLDSECRKSFSTFGKESGSEEEVSPGVPVGGGGSDACGAMAAGGGAGGSLLTEMNHVLQRLLPPNANNVNSGYSDCGETAAAASSIPPPITSSSTLERGTACGSSGNHGGAVPQEGRKGLLPGGKGPVYPPGVAAWAANTHYLNPGNGNPAPSQPTPAPSSTNGNANANGQPPHLKWLPAMEEIPENYEEDEFEGVFQQSNPGALGKRVPVEGAPPREGDMEASELVNEINKLLQDVRQSS